MVLWNALPIFAIPMLSSGRAAILGYTMPIFSAVLGSLFFHDRLAPRAWAGVAAALAGVLLLLWHEVGALGSRPIGVGLMLAAALSWAFGTQKLRRAEVPVPLRSEEHTSELQSPCNLVCRLLLEKKKTRRPVCCSL